MKKYLLTAFVILLFGCSDICSGQISGRADNKTRLYKLKNEVTDDLTRDLLPFWSTTMLDAKNGGFVGRIDVNNNIYADEDKGGILNARILWTFSSAYLILNDSAYLKVASRAKDYIMAHFIDKRYGGAYRSIKSNGEPSDNRKQVYTQSFFIYGLTEYYMATGDSGALNSAKRIFELLEKYALDKSSGGYFEVFTRDWKRTRDLLIGEKSVSDEKTMNTQLHVLEAYTNLYRVWPDSRMGERLRSLINIFTEHIIDTNSFHLICFMDRNWNRTSATDSYGHDIESSWLLVEAARLLGDRDLISRVKEISIRISDAADEGLQADGSLIYEKDLTNGRVNAERSWWVQSEAIVGNLNAYELSGKEKYLENSLKCWEFTRNHFVDHRFGGWFSSVTLTGAVGLGDKAGFWVCPYHNGRMCMEIIERVTHLNAQ